MSNDDNGTNWRDRVKTPSKTNEKSIGGGSSFPQKDGKEIDWKKLTEEELKEKEYDKKLHGKDLDKALAEKEKRAIKGYENRVTKPNLPESQKTEKALIDKLDDFVDEAGQGLKKAAPYLDNAAKVIGEVGKVGGVTAGVVGFFNPESTVDEETEQRLLREWEEQQLLLKPEEIKEPENISFEEKNKIMAAIKEFEKPTSQIEQPEISAPEKEKLMATMKDFEELEKPDFLKALEATEPEPPEIEMGDPSMDASDGSDGGADGGGDGGE